MLNAANYPEMELIRMRIKSYRGAGVMLFRYNTRYRRFEVLLGKRSVPRGYGKWAIPGGGVESYDVDFAACVTSA